MSRNLIVLMAVALNLLMGADPSLAKWLDAGGDSACVVDATGKLLCWGYSSSGALGTGGATESSVPAQVAGPLNQAGIRSVSVGDDHACALDNAGNAWCWGEGDNGQNGNGQQDSSTPGPIVMSAVLPNTFSVIDTSNYHSCALDTAGNAWCWGYGLYGALGNESTSEANTPAKVFMPTGRFFRRIATGDYHSCAVDDMSKGWCWGNNDNGQLGNWGGGAISPSPVSMPSGVQFADIFAGGNRTCAIDQFGRIWCWGSGTVSGGDLTPLLIEIDAELGDPTFVEVSIGYGFACGLDSAGDVWCWGSDQYGQLGDDDVLADKESPVKVMRVGTQGVFESIALGDYFACASTTGGGVYCWGYGDSGAIGVGVDGETANAVTAPISDVTKISAAGAHTCALRQNGEAWCWGEDQNGELGNGLPLADSGIPVRVVDTMLPVGSRFSSIVAGANFNCALDDSGNAWCWGLNVYGELGSVGASTSIPRAVDMTLMPPGGLVQLSAGWGYACGIDIESDIWCWGSGHAGELGIGTTNLVSDVPPTKLSIPGKKFVEVAASRDHTCAIEASDGSIYCWGEGSATGWPAGEAHGTPTLIPYLGNLAFTNIAAGESHTCAARPTSDGNQTSELWCFGNNLYGQLGGSIDNESTQPIRVGGVFVGGKGTANLQGRIALGSGHSCIVSSFLAQAACWGKNYDGQLVDGTFDSRDAPVGSLLGQVAQIAAGYDHSCAIRLDGAVVCAGSQDSGQLGDGVIGNPPVPQRLEILAKSNHIFSHGFE